MPTLQRVLRTQKQPVETHEQAAQQLKKQWPHFFYQVQPKVKVKW